MRLGVSAAAGLLLLSASAAAQDRDGLPVPAPGWSIEVVAEAPRIRFPTAVSVAPDGRVFVAEDPMDQTGPVDRPVDRVVCLHPDGRITTFADTLYAAFGLLYLEGKLYVVNAPRLTVLSDGGAEGRDRTELIECLLPAPWEHNRMNEHVPSGLRLAMDGRLYLSVGSKGVFGASGRDGRPFQMRMGGVVLLRPDATGLEAHVQGTRNTLDVVLASDDTAFLVDNNCHTATWPTCLLHLQDGAYYGYPYDCKPLRLPALLPVADLQGGAPVGALAYTEDALPGEFRDNIFYCDWARSQIVRLRLERRGSSWALAGRETILAKGGSEFRPMGLDLSADGTSFYIADWNHPGSRSKKDVGRLLKLTWTGPSQAAPKPDWYLDAALGRPCRASCGELYAGLSHGSRRVRLAAQRQFVLRGTDCAGALEGLLADDDAPVPARLHALWALDGMGTGRSATIAALSASEAAVRGQAARQLGVRRAKEAVGPLLALLRDPAARVALQAVVALGRIGEPQAVAPLLGFLEDPDLFLRHATWTALNRLGRSDPKAWSAIVPGLGSPRPARVEATVQALRDTWDATLVDALAEAPLRGAGRAAAVRLLAAVALRPPPWDGLWWRRGPYGPAEDDRTMLPRIDRTERWAGTPAVLKGLRSGLEDPEADVRREAAAGLGEAGDRESAATLRGRFDREGDPGVRGAILRALAALGDPAVPLRVLLDPAPAADLLREAVRAAAHLGDAETTRALVRRVEETALDAETLAASLDALGRLKAGASAAAARVTHPEVSVAVAAVSALGKMGDERALGTALADARPPVRRAAVAALGERRSRRAVPDLLQAYADPETRAEALAALLQVPDARARQAYLDGLAGKNAALRERCRQALQAIQAGADVPARPDPAAYAASAAARPGDPGRGRAVFHDAKGAGCSKCHRAGGEGGDVGPELTGVGAKYDRATLADSVLFPSKQITEGFRQTILRLKDGTVVSGAVRGETGDELLLVDAEARRVSIRKESIEERKASELSVMPEGLHAGLTLEEFADLVAFLESLKAGSPK